MGFSANRFTRIDSRESIHANRFTRIALRIARPSKSRQCPFPGPFGPRAPECPKSVPRVSPECQKGVLDTPGTLSGHFVDSSEPGARRAPGHPEGHPEGHSGTLRARWARETPVAGRGSCNPNLNSSKSRSTNISWVVHMRENRTICTCGVPYFQAGSRVHPKPARAFTRTLAKPGEVSRTLANPQHHIHENLPDIHQSSGEGPPHSPEFRRRCLLYVGGLQNAANICI